MPLRGWITTQRRGGVYPLPPFRRDVAFAGGAQPRTYEEGSPRNVGEGFIPSHRSGVRWRSRAGFNPAPTHGIRWAVLTLELIADGSHTNPPLNGGGDVRTPDPALHLNTEH